MCASFYHQLHLASCFLFPLIYNCLKGMPPRTRQVRSHLLDPCHPCQNSTSQYQELNPTADQRNDGSVGERVPGVWWMGQDLMCSGQRQKCRCRVWACAAGNRPHSKLGQWSKECQGQAWDDYVINSSTAEECFWIYKATVQYYLVGDCTWGEAMCSFTHHFQVWMPKCWVKVEACLICWLFAMIFPIEPWTI